MTALPRPINRIGARARRWARWHSESRRQVFYRSRGRCEVGGCSADATDWAHMFQRGNLINEPWCSTSELTAGLCRQHHNDIDRHLDPDLRDQLRWRAVAALTETYPLPDFWPYDVHFGPITAVREAVRQLEAAGWTWDEDLGEIVLRAVA